MADQYYYNREDWKALRLASFERDGYACQGCGTEGIAKTHFDRERRTPENFPGKLIAHHLIPRKQGGRDELSNLITLCPKCHSKAHVKQP